MTDHDRQDILGMPLCTGYATACALCMQRAQAVASMCYFQNLQCVIRDALFVLLGLVSSGSHASY